MDEFNGYTADRSMYPHRIDDIFFCIDDDRLGLPTSVQYGKKSGLDCLVKIFGKHRHLHKKSHKVRNLAIATLLHPTILRKHEVIKLVGKP